MRVNLHVNAAGYSPGHQTTDHYGEVPPPLPARFARVELRVVAFDHPDAQELTEQVQQEYVVRYGGTDATPMRFDEFAPPLGLFLVGYVDGRPVGCGGWRTVSIGEPVLRDGDAELKRMYVVPTARGHGHARRLLGELERTAAAAGFTRMVLETGIRQPEAISLYLSCGYEPISGFGMHKDAPGSRCFAKPLVASMST